MKYIHKLQNKRILIFGGTSGIGSGVVDACIEHGAYVFVAGSNQERLDKAVQRLEEAYPNHAPGKVTGHQCDLSDAESLDANIQSLLNTVTEGGNKKLDHIVFTAGNSLPFKPIEEFNLALFQQFMLVRTVAPLVIAKYIRKYVEMSADSSFTITGGVNTEKPSAQWTLVAAGGGAMQGIVRGLAVELAPIRSNCVEPGAIQTEWFDRSTDQTRQKFLDATTVGRVGRPEDIAEAYLYLMKDGFVTGSLIKSNGGYLLK